MDMINVESFLKYCYNLPNVTTATCQYTRHTARQDVYVRVYQNINASWWNNLSASSLEIYSGIFMYRKNNLGYQESFQKRMLTQGVRSTSGEVGGEGEELAHITR